MPTYEIYCRCIDCKREHPLHMKIHLERGPDRKMSAAEYFGEGSIPPQVAALRHHNALCLRTGLRFELENDEQILLLPI